MILHALTNQRAIGNQPTTRITTYSYRRKGRVDYADNSEHAEETGQSAGEIGTTQRVYPVLPAYADGSVKIATGFGMREKLGSKDVHSLTSLIPLNSLTHRSALHHPATLIWAGQWGAER